MSVCFLNRQQNRQMNLLPRSIKLLVVVVLVWDLDQLFEVISKLPPLKRQS
jgi:hypothetical protein